MTDPTIPEIVARLRELHEKLQALQVGTPEFTAARQLFRDVLQLSAPGILDALDHVGDAAAHSPDGGKEKGARVADRKPKFGDWFRNPHASDDNPTRDGMYVRTVRRTGRMNRGTWYELTDGTGKFWQVRPDALQPLTSYPWRPIEECGELERGRYLVQLRSGAQIVALWSGDSEGWVLRQRDLDEFDSPRD